MELSLLAENLLDRMRTGKARSSYDTEVLGSMFRPGDVARLDDAYRELEREGLIERTRAEFSFFGDIKPIYRLSAKGRATVGSEA